MGVLHKILNGGNADFNPDPDDYGTEKGPGAGRARTATGEKRFATEDPAPTLGEAMFGAKTKKAGREASDTERREGRMTPRATPKMAKGGLVRRGYGKARGA